MAVTTSDSTNNTTITTGTAAIEALTSSHIDVTSHASTATAQHDDTNLKQTASELDFAATIMFSDVYKIEKKYVNQQ